ncbi:MAG: Sugar phosphate isomerase/epimerase [Microbacteriaceae bacterium]|nr:Sugar phosphate isomerase/epimerase [Microbacteriaceae bacterium]
MEKPRGSGTGSGSRRARVAGAPISWGVSEVPGWGFQLDPERVLGEMHELGLSATEFGPDGFLPESPSAKATLLARFDLTAVGSFVPVVLHRAGGDLLPGIHRVLDDYAAAGAGVLVLAAVTGDDGYDAERPELTESEWATLFENLDRIRGVAAARGVVAVLHPHAGTVVESAADVERVLSGSGIGFCFDTGHLMIGGTDPVLFAQQHADRIAHAHLKDVSVAGIERVKSGELSYFEAVAADLLYRPLGQGDIDIRAILSSLSASGYDGWYVLEQDRVLDAEPAPGEGPIAAAGASLEFLRAVLNEVSA